MNDLQPIATYKNIKMGLPKEIENSNAHRTYQYLYIPQGEIGQFSHLQNIDKLTKLTRVFHKAFYLQPLVPMVYELIIISDEEYKQKLNEEYIYTIYNKGGIESIFQESNNKVKRLANNRDISSKRKDYNGLIFESNDASILHCWDLVKTMDNKSIKEYLSKLNINDIIQNIPVLQIRLKLLPLINKEETKSIIMNIMTNVFFNQELSKIEAKVMNSISSQYIAVSDKRLYNKDFNIDVPNSGNQVVDYRVFSDLIKKYYEINQNMLTEAYVKTDYTFDYMEANKLYQVLLETYHKNVSERNNQDSIQLLIEKYKLDHILYLQQSFYKQNTWDLKDKNQNIILDASNFKTEWDFLQHAVQVIEKENNQDIDLNTVFNNSEKFLFDKNNNNDIFTIYRSKQEYKDNCLSPTVVLDFNELTFNYTAELHTKFN